MTGNSKSEKKHRMDWNLPSPRWIFFFNAVVFLLGVSLAKTLDPVVWSTNNADFFPNGLTIEAEIDDIVDIVCPQADNTEDAEYHTLVQVDRHGFKNCSLDVPGSRTRRLLDCNRPFQRNLYTLLFQRFTPFPGRPYFEEGEDYYFISTSDGTRQGMSQRQGGLCRSHNMKLTVHIGPRPAVIFEGEIKLLSLGGVILDWDDSLRNHFSPRYNEVTFEVEYALRDLYGNEDGFVKAEVTGYRRGSVIVKFQVHFAEGSSVNIDTIQRPLQETAQPFGDIVVDPDSVYVEVISEKQRTTARTTTKDARPTTPESPRLPTVKTSYMPPWKPITSNEVLPPRKPGSDKEGKKGQSNSHQQHDRNISSRTQHSLVTLFVSFLCAVVRWHH